MFYLPLFFELHKNFLSLKVMKHRCVQHTSLRVNYISMTRMQKKSINITILIKLPQDQTRDMVTQCLPRPNMYIIKRCVYFMYM